MNLQKRSCFIRTGCLVRRDSLIDTSTPTVSVQIELAALLGTKQRFPERVSIVSVQIELAALLGYFLLYGVWSRTVSVQIELAALLGVSGFCMGRFLLFPSRSNWLPC